MWCGGISVQRARRFRDGGRRARFLALGRRLGAEGTLPPASGGCGTHFLKLLFKFTWRSITSAQESPPCAWTAT